MKTEGNEFINRRDLDESNNFFFEDSELSDDVARLENNKHEQGALSHNFESNSKNPNLLNIRDLGNFHKKNAIGLKRGNN